MPKHKDLEISFERAAKVVPKVTLEGVYLIGSKSVLSEKLWETTENKIEEISSDSCDNLSEKKLLDERWIASPQTREKISLRETKPAGKKFWVVCDFGVRYVTPDNEVIFMHEAQFCLHYILTSRKGISRADLLSFAGFNAPHNAWPYWREFLHNVTMRMPIPYVLLPLRLPPFPISRPEQK